MCLVPVEKDSQIQEWSVGNFGKRNHLKVYNESLLKFAVILLGTLARK